MNKCKGCGKQVERSIFINGCNREIRRRTYCLKCNPYKTKTQTATSVERECSKCHKIKNMSDFYTKNGAITHFYCKDCSKYDTLLRMREFKVKCLDYRGGKCIKCGYAKCPNALDFHHRDPTQKEFGISMFSRNTTVLSDKIKVELDKCDILCANCHREFHYNLTTEIRLRGIEPHAPPAPSC